MAARIALEGKPKTLGDFINRYYYALGTLRRGRSAFWKKPSRGRRAALLSSYETDPAMREAVTASENAARAANAPMAGATFIKPGSSPADTVKALRDSADELKFGNTDTLTYHVRKHHNEMPKSEWAGEPASRPPRSRPTWPSSQDAHAQPAEKVYSKPTQDSLGTVYTFERPKGPVKASGQPVSRLHDPRPLRRPGHHPHLRPADGLPQRPRRVARSARARARPRAAGHGRRGAGGVAAEAVDALFGVGLALSARTLSLPLVQPLLDRTREPEWRSSARASSSS